MQRLAPASFLASLLLACLWLQAGAVEINDMKCFEDLYGRYAAQAIASACRRSWSMRMA